MNRPFWTSEFSSRTFIYNFVLYIKITKDKKKNLLKKKAEMLSYKRIKITQKKRQGLQTSPCFKVLLSIGIFL